MRETGLTYKELEQQGVYLASRKSACVTGAARPLRRLVKVRCWVRRAASRRVTFATRSSRGDGRATGHRRDILVSLTHQHTLRAFRRMSLTCFQSRFPIPWSSKRSMLSIVIIPTPRFRLTLETANIFADPRIARSYIAACALLAGCPRPPPAPLVPQHWPGGSGLCRCLESGHVALATPRSGSVEVSDDQKRWGGRGQAACAADSLRFDYVGAAGLGAGAAAIVADSRSGRIRSRTSAR